MPEQNMTHNESSFYITTPIYYVNGSPHIGTALTTVACDVLTRYHKLHGDQPFFLTGTDENGSKIQEAADIAGIPAPEFVDALADEFRSAWNDLNIDYDVFIRTTEPRHVRAVQEFFSRLLERGHIYKDTYEGWYSVSDETFYRDADVEHGKSKETGKPVTRVQEENYFFRLSAFSEKLLIHIQQHPEFLLPEFRCNEALRFIQDGLRDMCITRSNKGWGIPFPGDESKVIYVWFDALISYIAGIGWPDNEDWKLHWPAAVHFMGKEIFVRFHATLWPAMLMALDIPLPKQIFAHGFWTIPGLKPGEKAGKSTGGLPHPTAFSRFLAERSGADVQLGADALRYLLCREMNFGYDTEFTVENFLRRYNTDLANDLGNLLNRTINMAHKYLNGAALSDELDQETASLAKRTLDDYCSSMSQFRLNHALESVWKLIGRMNKYLDEQAPWRLAKQAESGDADSALQLRTVLATCLEVTRVSTLLVSPFMPAAAERMLLQMGHNRPISQSTWEDIQWGAAGTGVKLNSPLPVFPRIQNMDVNEEDLRFLGSLKELQNQEKADAVNDSNIPIGAPVSPDAAEKPADSLLTIEEFMRVKLQAGEVLAAEAVPNATKLLRLTVNLGEEEARTILAGIAEFYIPESLIGRQVVVVANLQPRKMRGIESQGMLLAADIDGRPVLLNPDERVPNGSRVR